MDFKVDLGQYEIKPHDEGCVYAENYGRQKTTNLKDAARNGGWIDVSSGANR